MYRNALDALAGLDVTGVGAASNHGVDRLPLRLARDHLPALLVLPFEPPGLRSARPLFGEQGEGFQSPAFSNGVTMLTCTATHLLLVAFSAAGDGLRGQVPPLVALIDAYFTALKPLPTLGGALLEPARVRVEPGEFIYGGDRFTGCAFRHTWRIAV
ncbi:MAG: hypothetical protein ACOCXZ_03050 [Chloroflexota bacterium]